MEKNLILMVGPIGSGKTTFAKDLQKSFRPGSFIRISQDEMGRKAYLEYFNEALRDGVENVLVDRMNFNKNQRERFIKPAREAGYSVTIFELKTNRSICLDRVVSRKDHPTIEPWNQALAEDILNMYQRDYEAPTESEYDNYNEVKNEK